MNTKDIVLHVHLYEVYEKIEELMERVETLEKHVGTLESEILILKCRRPIDDSLPRPP